MTISPCIKKGHVRPYFNFITRALWQRLTRPSKVNEIAFDGLFYMVYFTNFIHNGTDSPELVSFWRCVISYSK
jgi:hypothetical protein